MIPNETLQTIDTLGQTSPVGNFRITDATQARILMSLSDKMYTRKELAVVREYSTNAADAHIVVDKPISDIQVSLPTMEDLNFRIRDFGTGLTENEIRDVYCVFGESTKRNSNKLNGVLGYGCKAGFAHADSFTVTSWNNGVKSIYQCIKGDSTKLHSSILLSREDCSDPSGIEICVPVKQGSWYTFHREAVAFYRNWPTMPTINGLSPEDTASLTKWRNTPATLKGEGWEVRPAIDGSRATAYMGWVPYQIDWNVLYHKMSLDSKSRALFELLRSNDVILYFGMGDINFVDSREHLEYTDKTFTVLVERIKAIFDKIKDSIQEKFVGLPTIWDAKIMYNAIFGTGILETEKGETETSGITERIKILDGNLMQLERTFQDAFTWNGITLKGPSFVDINRFDNADATKIFDDGHEPVAPVMVTYRKKKSRVKSNRCKSDKANTIVASEHVAVIINDTGRKTGQQMAARYLIFSGGEKGVNFYRTVHVLTFENKDLFKQFVSEYNFDTVPVLKLSQVLPLAKAWNNLHKVARNYGGGGGGVRPMRYIDLESGTIEETEVPVREIEDGGYYVDASASSRRRRGREQTHIKGKDLWNEIDADDAIKHFKTVCEELDLDVERIYIITGKTQESKWFQAAIASGDWTNVWKVIEEAMPNLTIDVNLMVDAENFEGTTTVGDEWCKKLVPLIMDKTSPFLKLISTVGGKDYEKLIKVKDAFDGLCLWNDVKGEHKGTIDFEKSAEFAQAAYPYLPWNTVEYDSNINDENLATVSKYINALDLYVDLTKDTKPVEAPKAEETEAVAA